MDSDSDDKNECVKIRLVCPICFEKLRPPIFQCGTGHTMCEKCLKKLKSCPFCQITLNRRIRNYFLEDTCVHTKYPCKFKNFGCSEIFYLTKIIEHEKICVFRNFQCPVGKCTFENNKFELIKHFGRVHEDVILKPTLNQEFFDLNNDYDQSFVLTKTDLFRLCYLDKRLHVHSFNLEEENSYTLRFYYKAEGVRRNITVSEFCVNFDEECWLRCNVDVSNLQNVFKPSKLVQGSCCVDLKFDSKLLSSIISHDVLNDDTDHIDNNENSDDYSDVSRISNDYEYA